MPPCFLLNLFPGPVSLQLNQDEGAEERAILSLTRSLLPENVTVRMGANSKT